MIPLPTPCGQNWLEMTPTQKGRICLKCEKTIVDFSKKSWADIERIQKENNLSVCGMYSNKQPHYWGQEIPSKGLISIAAKTALLVALTSATSGFSQSGGVKDNIQKKIIRGTVTGKSLWGNIDTLSMVWIQLKNSKIGTISDANGNYELELTDYIDTIPNPTIVFFFPEYYELEFNINPEIKGEQIYNAQLIGSINNTINKSPDLLITNPFFYSLNKPTLIRRIKWRFKNLFK